MDGLLVDQLLRAELGRIMPIWTRDHTGMQQWKLFAKSTGGKPFLKTLLQPLFQEDNSQAIKEAQEALYALSGISSSEHDECDFGGLGSVLEGLLGWNPLFKYKQLKASADNARDRMNRLIGATQTIDATRSEEADHIGVGVHADVVLVLN